MELREAANLIQAGYDNTLGSSVLKAYDAHGVQAFVLKDRTLVIPGTNERRDWRTNFNVGKGSSGRIWHRGFLEHARAVFAFAAPLKPKLVLGHSLGAASAQIVAVSLNIPAICYASPQPLRGQRWFKGEYRIMNICRRDDAVAKLPPSFLRWRTMPMHCSTITGNRWPGISARRSRRRSKA